MMIDDICSPSDSAPSYCDVVFITVGPKSISKSAPRSYRSSCVSSRRRRRGRGSSLRRPNCSPPTATRARHSRRSPRRPGSPPKPFRGMAPRRRSLIAAIEYTGFGVVGEENVFNLDVGRHLLAIDDLDEAVDYVADGRHRYPRNGPLRWRPHCSAARIPMPSWSGTWTTFSRASTLQFRRILEVYRDRGWLRVDVPFDELLETTVVVCSVDTYLRITQRGGWSVDAYRSWLPSHARRDRFPFPERLRRSSRSATSRLPSSL